MKGIEIYPGEENIYIDCWDQDAYSIERDGDGNVVRVTLSETTEVQRYQGSDSTFLTIPDVPYLRVTSFNYVDGRLTEVRRKITGEYWCSGDVITEFEKKSEKSGTHTDQSFSNSSRAHAAQVQNLTRD